MHTDADVLGDEGRKVLDACVKVKIIGKPESMLRYIWGAAENRLWSCYAGRYPQGVRRDNYSIDESVPNCHFPINRDPAWLHIKGFRSSDDNVYLPKKEKTYDIIDIYNELVKKDQLLYVEKYPKPGPESDELKKLIDKRRTDIERECEEATADPDASQRYSWLVAQRRVRDCYAGNFAGDRAVLENDKEHYDISEIHDAVSKIYSEDKYLKKFPEDEGPGCNELKELIQAHRSGVENEYQEAKCRSPRYSHSVAEKKVRDIFGGCLPQNENIFPIKEGESGERNANQSYDLFDIHKSCLRFLKEIDPDRANWVAHTKEYEKTKGKLRKYSCAEAERRVRDCFAGTFPQDTDIFPNKEKENSGTPRSQQTYDIFEIKKAVDHFDVKKLFDKHVSEKDSKSGIMNQLVDEQRAQIMEEYDEATTKVEVDHGSGFIVHDHFIITNKHVIEDVGQKEIYISNAAIGELPCEVAYADAVKDLALLYCQQLTLNQNEIYPLQLSNQSPLLGTKVFSFGYPMSHTGESALFVNGYVSGSKETYSGQKMIVLNCPLNSGCSGGPVFIGGQLKVVGVATQKHFKEILTLEERRKIEKIRESFQTSSIVTCGADDIFHKHCGHRQTRMNLLTLKLYDALETHSQFNLSNALPGHCVVEFIKETISKYNGEGKKELHEIVKWSEDHANILPSGHHSASDCCIQ